ncbi:O-glucosyltransferase rumi homolog [Daphnia pulex]|uniref:O-glucosyltransferase rumi homolog n=1 Tax=Daphnia pulex TaxID=6669 RepID=UPI001EDE0795|nr:O-glucosyltransferase rumi homolog [Daphnia pulex]
MECLCQIVVDFKLCLQFYIGLLVFIFGVKCTGTVEEFGYCTKLNGCNQNEVEENMYTQENNENWVEFKGHISQSLLDYKPCLFKNCSCFTNLVIEDLKAFKDVGITKSMLDKAKDRGTKYQIIGQKLYRESFCLFPSRCAGIEHFILKVIKELPDMELIINNRDWPQVSRHFGEVLPILSFSKTKEYLDITYPAWTFWEGGPAINLYPRGLGRWDQHRISIDKVAATYPWNEKQSKAFFRGSRTSSERDPLILLSRGNLNLVDAQYTKNQAWKSDSDTLGAPPAEEVSLESHCSYKYLFNYRGVAASFRFKHLFLCKSLVFHVGDEWIEFFYPALKPWVHYIPVSSAATQRDLARLIRFAKENDSLVSKIATRGHQLVWNHLKLSDVECYWKFLLTEYAKLLRFKPQLDRQLITI